MAKWFRRLSVGSPRTIVMRAQQSKSLREHISHTVPALETLISLHLIGAYIAKRGRYEYLRTLLTPDVNNTDWRQGWMSQKTPMAFWPIGTGDGELEELAKWGGRLSL